MKKGIVLFFTISFVMVILILIGKFLSSSSKEIALNQDRVILSQINLLLESSRKSLNSLSDDERKMLDEGGFPMNFIEPDVFEGSVSCTPTAERYNFSANNTTVEDFISFLKLQDISLMDPYSLWNMVQSTPYEVLEKNPYFGKNTVSKWQFNEIAEYYSKMRKDDAALDLVDNEYIQFDSDNKTHLLCNLDVITLGYNIKLHYNYSYNSGQEGEIVEVGFTYTKQEEGE